VAKRNYYPLATVANKKKCLPLTQKMVLWVLRRRFKCDFLSKYA
jgi:hypothetical protein